MWPTNVIWRKKTCNCVQLQKRIDQIVLVIAGWLNEVAAKSAKMQKSLEVLNVRPDFKGKEATCEAA